MSKVSIIVPVYNVEDYLEKCIKSLVCQTLKDIEIIIVNDGTKDNSEEIINKYAKKYKNIKSYKKENGGLSSARNYGLKHATGEYIGFVDSDDYVELDMYEKMYNKAKKNNFDIVVCDTNYVFSSNTKKASSNIKNDIFKKEEIKKSMLYIYPSAWNKIYKRSLFNSGLLFKEKVWYEDVEFLYRLYPTITSIGVVNDPLYNYVQREGAITKTFDERVYNYIDNWNGIVKYYKANNLYDDYKKEIEYCYVRYMYATFIKTASNFTDKELYKKAVRDAICNVKKYFPKYRRNSYFYTSLKGIYLVLFNRALAYLIYKFKKRR